MPGIIDASNIIYRPVKVTFLEMHDRKGEPAMLQGTRFDLLPKPIDAGLYRKYYYGVGEKYSWLDRMVMDTEELSQKINADNVEIFIFYVGNEVAGFIEFLQEQKFIEIVYFGLLPAFIGKGFGTYFLQWVIGKAWSYNRDRIQLNTCTLDHPNALPTYLKAGFTEVRTEKHQRRVIP